MIERRMVLGLVSILLVNLPANLKAQSTFGSLRDSTMDQSGAAIPATV